MRLPIQLRRGGSWVTVITGPPSGYMTKVTTRQAGTKTATPTQAGGNVIEAVVTIPTPAGRFVGARFGTYPDPTKSN